MKTFNILLWKGHHNVSQTKQKVCKAVCIAFAFLEKRKKIKIIYLIFLYMPEETITNSNKKLPVRGERQRATIVGQTFHCVVFYFISFNFWTMWITYEKLKLKMLYLISNNLEGSENNVLWKLWMKSNVTPMVKTMTLKMHKIWIEKIYMI